MVSFWRHIIVITAAGMLVSCATSRPIGQAPDVEVTALEQLPPPRGEGSYLVGPQEKLEINVVGAESLSGTYLTDTDGRLAFPLIGIVELEGRTPGDAAILIADRLRGRYVLDPQVRVIPDEVPKPSISVGGQVKKPGSYSAVGKQTLLRVVNQAEGLTEYAREEEVLVLRTVDNQRYIGVYSLAAIQRGNYPDPQLYANDIVMVGDSPDRRRLETILQILPPLLTTAAILISR